MHDFRRIQIARLLLSCAVRLVVTLSISFGDEASKGTDEARPKTDLLKPEKLSGEGVWIDPRIEQIPNRSIPIRVTVWFEDQLLGDGAAYTRRAAEFAKRKRTELRLAATATLKHIHLESWKAAEARINELSKDKLISDVEQHWIVNGFSCSTSRAA